MSTFRLFPPPSFCFPEPLDFCLLFLVFHPVLCSSLHFLLILASLFFFILPGSTPSTTSPVLLFILCSFLVSCPDSIIVFLASLPHQFFLPLVSFIPPPSRSSSHFSCFLSSEPSALTARRRTTRRLYPQFTSSHNEDDGRSRCTVQTLKAAIRRSL